MAKKTSSVGSWLFYAWAAAVIATLGSLYLSEIAHFVPCSLCWFQRICMYPLAIILGIASAKNQAEIITYALPLAGIGLAFSGYHIWIQERPHAVGSASCGPVSCVEDVLNAFGFLTVPMLAGAAFCVIIFCLLQARKAANR